MDIKIINLENTTDSSVNFDLDNVVVDNSKSVAYVINWQLSRKRSGTAKTKLMSEISGTTAKPYKQKGTGRARQGSKRSVQFRGGRTCFGPLPRSFDYPMPKKIVKKAIADVLKLKIKENKVVLFNGNFSNLKTSYINKILKNHNINSALFLYQNSESVAGLLTSVKNIKNVKSLDFRAINVYDIVKFNYLMLDEKLFGSIKEVIS